jgi:hypothetical protein
MLLTLAGCGGQGRPEAQPSSSDPFPLTLGSRWDLAISVIHHPTLSQSRQVVDMRSVDGVIVHVVGIDGAWSIPGEAWYEKTDAAVRWLPSDADSAFARAIGPRVILRLPLQPADRWVQVDKTVDTLVDYDGDGLTDRAEIFAEAVVGGIEAVATPAGSFADATRVVTTETATVIGTVDGARVHESRTEIREWYAPGVGLVQRQVRSLSDTSIWEYQRSEVLTAYHIVSQGP